MGDQPAVKLWPAIIFSLNDPVCRGLGLKKDFSYHKVAPLTAKARLLYSWIERQKYAHKKLIPQGTKRATTNPRPRMKSFRQGDSKYFCAKFP